MINSLSLSKFYKHRQNNFQIGVCGFNPKSTVLFSAGAALGLFSTPLCKIRSRHSKKLKLTGLISYIMSYKICKFESSTIINDVIMTSSQKTMANFGVLQ